MWTSGNTGMVWAIDKIIEHKQVDERIMNATLHALNLSYLLPMAMSDSGESITKGLSDVSTRLSFHA